MDYKELIERLNKYSAENECHGGITAEAADAIETLLAEREAAMKDLRYRGCDICKYEGLGSLEYPCYHCKNAGGMSDNWEWRGQAPHDRKSES